jgi:hypothetical protein
MSNKLNSKKLNLTYQLTHSETIKFVGAQQAKLDNTYKNTKLKLLKTNTAIWFNKICRDLNYNPNTLASKSTDVIYRSALVGT